MEEVEDDKSKEEPWEHTPAFNITRFDSYVVYSRRHTRIASSTQTVQSKTFPPTVNSKCWTRSLGKTLCSFVIHRQSKCPWCSTQLCLHSSFFTAVVLLLKTGFFCLVFQANQWWVILFIYYFWFNPASQFRDPGVRPAPRVASRASG